jgi:hypothetical protein
MLRFNSLLTISNYACRSVKRSVTISESTANITGGST